MAADNRFLGKFDLSDIPPARMGTPQIEVSFNIDANGILNVSAKDKGTGKEHSIQITSSGGLSKDEIDRMQRDAEAHAADDKAKRELAEARNPAEQQVYQLEKTDGRAQGQAVRADKAAVRAAIEKVNEAKKGDDPAALTRAVDDLRQRRPGDGRAPLRQRRQGRPRRRCRRRPTARAPATARPTAARRARPTTSSTSSSKRRSSPIANPIRERPGRPRATRPGPPGSISFPHPLPHPPTAEESGRCPSTMLGPPTRSWSRSPATCRRRSATAGPSLGLLRRLLPALQGRRHQGDPPDRRRQAPEAPAGRLPGASAPRPLRHHHPEAPRPQRFRQPPPPRRRLVGALRHPRRDDRRRRQFLVRALQGRPRLRRLARGPLLLSREGAPAWPPTPPPSPRSRPPRPSSRPRASTAGPRARTTSWCHRRPVRRGLDAPAPRNQICEYIDGLIYMPNAPTDEHQDVAGFLFDILNGFRYARGLVPSGSRPCALPLSVDRFPQPDVFVKPPEGGEDVPRPADGRDPLPLDQGPRPVREFADVPRARHPRTLVHRHGGAGLAGRASRGRRRVFDPSGRVGHVGGLRPAGVLERRLVALGPPLPNPRRCLESILAGMPA